MAELKLAYVNLTQPQPQQQFRTAAKEEPFLMMLENCTLDPIIFSAHSIISLTIQGSTLTPAMWRSVKSTPWPDLSMAVLVQCSSSYWQEVLNTLPPCTEELHLSDNKGDMSLVTLKHFTQLRKLACTNSRADSLLRKAPFAETLTILHLDNCMLTVNQLPDVARLTNLIHLSLANNRLTTRGDKSLECLKTLTKLNHLNVDSCGIGQLCGVLLSYALSEMKNLQKLFIAHNNGLRSVGLTFILTALTFNKGMITIDVGFKAFSRDQHLPIDYQVWKALDAASRDTMISNCRKIKDYAVKKGNETTCYECYHDAQQHRMKCKECRGAVGSTSCAAMAEKKCDHNKECAICISTFDSSTKVMELACHHVFCYTCIMAWTKEHWSCPTCRKPIIHD